MKKLIAISLLSPLALTMAAQISSTEGVENWDGVPVLEYTYITKISSNGMWAVGQSGDGGTVRYDVANGELYYHAMMDYGKGNVVSDNGWIVGCENREDGSGTIAKILMPNNQYVTPSVFPTNNTSNIHGITPDGSRICGVTGDPTGAYMNLPFYCDIDANGTVGPIQYLPFDKKDFFGGYPQYVTANWISADGKTISGYVVISNGQATYPIIYKQQNDGTWQASYPSAPLFNPDNLPFEPEQSIEELFPDAPYPDVKNFMTAQEYTKFVTAGEPYDELENYMTEEEYNAYLVAEDKYLEAQMEYEEYFSKYQAQFWAIYDSSIFFYYSGMSLSLDGNWWAGCARIFNPRNLEQFYLVPYLCNLQTGEWTQFGPDNSSFYVSQVLTGGVTVVNTPKGDVRPAMTYLYYPSKREFVSLYDYMQGSNPAIAEWMEERLTGDILDFDSDGNPTNSTSAIITGQAAFSSDSSIVAGGFDGYVLGLEQYMSYVFTDLVSAVKSIQNDTDFDGTYTVYNLNGVKVLSTRDISDVKSLAKGIYIVNGRKVIL